MLSCSLTREQKTHLFLSKGAGTTASLTPAPAAPNVHADGSTSARALSSSDVAVLKDDLVFRHAANVWQRMREDVTGVNRGARNDGSRAMADEDMIDEQIPPVMSIAQVQDALHELQASAATSLTAGALRRDAAVRTMLSVKVPRMIAIIKHVGPVKTRVGAAQDVTVRLVDGSGMAGSVP